MSGGNASFVKRSAGFANGARRGGVGGRLRLAFADMVAILGRRRLWATCVVLIGLFTMIGPFGTLERLGVPERLGYWSAVMLVGWSVAAAHVALALRFLPALLPETLRAAIGGAATAPCMMHAVAELNEAVFDAPFAWLTDSPLRMALFAGLAAALTLLSRLVDPVSADLLEAEAAAARRSAEDRDALTTAPEPVSPPRKEPADPAAPSRAASPPILRRMPPAKRGALLRLSMQDHYVEIVTASGSALALLRLSDAMAEAEGVPGLQVHRSHWVAEGAVADTRRENGRLRLTLIDGSEVPVSRARVAAVREAGWI
jgi:DNA-binding LytR/AlgR family response regulator